MTSKLPTYSDYKASGIDWLGDIPSHWECVKSQYIFSLASGETINGEDFSKGGLYPVYGGNGIRGYHDKYNLEGKHILIGRVGALCGNIHITPEKSWVSEHALIATPLKQVNLHWLSSLLETMKLGQYSMASAQPVIAASNVGKLHIPIPPIYEQKVIAAYLDDVTGKVDALIAEKRKQVEDIRAYRTSLITETVSHGLNPDAPLRPSGIDWLGDIPQHWEIIKSSYVFDNIGSGTTPTSGEDLYYEGGSVNWLQTGDLNDGVINSTSKKITPFAVESKNLKFYNKGSVVIAMYGATIAKLGLLNIQTTVNQACCVLTPSTNIYSKYAFYCFYSAKNELISLASGGGQPNISQATISDFKLPVPPLAEQQAIADFLDAKTAKIDELIGELTKQIGELTEYKQAVITEAVTGKVDVRDYKPSN